MLVCMNIKNVALIDTLEIEWKPRMTVLTGETGAGKSIIIDCVNLLLGARSDKTLVRYGTDKARIQGVFSVDRDISDMLENEGIEADGDTVLIDREISVEGRNICRINGMIVTQNFLREIGTRLINIHGQHDSQALLTADKHIDFLDEYAGIDFSEYTGLYNERKEILLKIENLSRSGQEREQRIDLLSYQTEEIAKAEIRAGEEEELKGRRLVIENAEKLAASVNEAYSLLYGDNCAYDMLSRAISSLERISGIDAGLDKIISGIADVKYTVEDGAHELGRYLDSIDFDENELNEIEEQLDIISKLKRKYGNSEQEIIDYYEKAAAELDVLKNSEEMTEEAAEQLKEVEKKLKNAALKISEARKKYSKKLQDEVEKVLSELDMPKIKFEVKLKPCDGFTSKGTETAEFLICPNVGEEMKPLVKIASGGELSRIMLAIKSVISDNVDTLIFDEIDTGVSGNAAKRIAVKLSELAKKRQVICVSHSPQIAAVSDNHLLISKSTEGKRTVTSVKMLSDEERIYEIARITDGNDITETSLKHAKEMMGI